MDNRFTRRSLLAGAAGLVGVARGAESPREKLREFAYGDVRLTGGPLKRQYDHLHRHYLGLNEDRLMKVYRQKAGLPAPGDDMGGWYDADGFVPGHTLGQYISALSRFHAGTGDAAAAAKARRLVEAWAETLGPDGSPYASEKGAITWPCYILDKYEIGMIDASRLAQVDLAKQILPAVIRGAMKRKVGGIPDRTFDRIPGRTPTPENPAPYDEPYILSENLFQAWEVTGERQFHEMAVKYLLNREYYEPLARGENVLPTKHAYSHTISLSSAAKAYLVLGDRKYLDAARNAWDMIDETQRWASGGWGPKEAFVTPHTGQLGDAISSTRDHFETPCGCYAQVKLARYLLRITGEAKYGEGLERVLYNTVLGSRDPDEDGNYFYYSNYQAGAKKGYYHRKWSCCSGTLAQGVADYPLNIYFHGDSGLYVNLFAPSTVKWAAGAVPVKVRQMGTYPEGEDVHFEVTPASAVEFTLHLRIPKWLERAAEIRVNGKKFDVAAERGTFAAIRRKWRQGDRVDVRFPARFRMEAVDDRHLKTAAVMKGALMYIAADAPLGMEKVALDLPGAIQSVGTGFAVEYGGAQVAIQPWHSALTQTPGQTMNTYFTTT
jgi:DUF1680 family protein